MTRPTLLTFDIFGTVVDWREGVRRAARAEGRELADAEFERIIDLQGELERRHPDRRYSRITAESLARVLGTPSARAAAIGAEVGRWPLFPDSREALRRLMRAAACAATTNSDLVHGEQVQEQLGFRLSAWLCAEELGLYKPSPDVWRKTAAALGVSPGRAWWHVSAYADYDLETAHGLGLTTVFVARPHRRPGSADLEVRDLAELADRVERLPG